MKAKMAYWIVLARLTWGEFDSPLHWRQNRQKFFPPPIVSIYKEAWFKFFSRN